MASSALYRYFPSRDELLTRLIVDAYDSLGAAVEDREAAVDRANLAGRFAAMPAVRDWALDHPNEYALIYGSPVPGYAAPADTVGPPAGSSGAPHIAEAAAAGRVDADIRDAESLAVRTPSPRSAPLPPGVPAPLVQRGLMVWANSSDVVSFELFGQLHNVVAESPADRKAFFDECIASWLAFTAIT